MQRICSLDGPTANLSLDFPVIYFDIPAVGCGYFADLGKKHSQNAGFVVTTVWFGVSNLCVICLV